MFRQNINLTKKYNKKLNLRIRSSVMKFQAENDISKEEFELEETVISGD